MTNPLQQNQPVNLSATSCWRVAACALVVWLFSYFVLLDPTDASTVGLFGQGPWKVSLEPEYRIKLDAVRWLFMPIHLVDRQIRRSTWTAEFDVNGKLIPPP